MILYCSSSISISNLRFNRNRNSDFSTFFPCESHWMRFPREENPWFFFGGVLFCCVAKYPNMLRPRETQTQSPVTFARAITWFLSECPPTFSYRHISLDLDLVVFFFRHSKVWRRTLMGNPLGKSTKGYAKASSLSASSQLKFKTRWWMNTAISSLASSNPAQSLGPPPNGM